MNAGVTAADYERPSPGLASAVVDDEFAWLEEVEGPEALAWVREINAGAEADLFGEPLFARLRQEVLEVLEADDRIPMPARHGDVVLNFWTDRSNRRGVLRRTTWERYRAADDPDWEIVLDVDALGRAEGESWVYKGGVTRRPDRRRTLVSLSPGGSDSSVTREFDLVENRFVPPEEGGFARPLAKGWLQWVDDDTVYVATDFGEGSLTSSGYPRTVRRWERGTPMEASEVVFEGEHSDVSVFAHVDTLPGYQHHVFQRRVDFFTGRRWLLRDGEFIEIDAPPDADVSVRERWLLVRPRKDWTVDGKTYAAGSLLAAELEAYLAGERSLDVLFDPTPTRSLAGWSWTRNHVLLTLQDDVRSRLEIRTPGEGWAEAPFRGAPPVWCVNAGPVDPDVSDECLLVGHDFLTPATLFHAAVGGDPEVLRTAPARFDTTGLSIAQRFVRSADGTRVPYFVVGPTDDSGPRPTLLGGYGGFEVTRTPDYSAILGRSWLSAGGTYVLANIRGGGEYGPAWHEAGLREKRHRVYEDFEAVARDLVETGITTPAQLGIVGGSNGGLLVGNMYVRSPELFGAVVCRVPLLDMKRYPHLLAGASWMAEYGDPDDPDDWEFIQTFSPYHLVAADRKYPPMLLTTSTRDDRVHPGHARKMAARLRKLGHDVTYWENIEGGHGGAADAAQEATMSALVYTFLHRHLIQPSLLGEAHG